MLQVNSKGLSSWMALLFLLTALSGAAVPESNSLTADEIIQRAVQQAEHSASRHNYSYRKITTSEELDSAGRVKDTKQKTWEIFSQNGQTRSRLLDVNGKPPSQLELKKNSENESSARQMLGQTKAATGENRQTFLTRDLVSRFDFRLEQQIPVNGRMAYELAFQPKRPPPRIHRMVDRLLNNLTGTIWIDADDFEMAKVRMQLRSEVDFWGGVLGTLRKMAYSIERTRMADGLWLNSQTTGDFEGRKLLESMHVRTSSKTLNFKITG